MRTNTVIIVASIALIAISARIHVDKRMKEIEHRVDDLTKYIMDEMNIEKKINTIDAELDRIRSEIK